MTSEVAAADDTMARMKRDATASKLAAAAMWDIVSLMMRSPAYRATTLAELDAMLLPAVRNQQFYVVHTRSVENGAVAPIAVLLWATVSAEVDQRIRANPAQRGALEVEDRKSGEIPWITDAVGDPKALEIALEHLKKTLFADRGINVLARSEAGEVVVRTV